MVGPGTGLGVGAILRWHGGAAVISSEGGHADFAPVSDEEVEIFAWLRQHYHRVSYERLLCGPGLLNIYHAIGGSESVTAPEQVTGAKAEDALAARAIRIFCEVLGSFAGNAALTFGAWGGVYLAGSLLKPMKEELLAGGFRARFDDKGRFGKELAKVPTLLVDEPALGLIGAAAALRHQNRSCMTGDIARIFGAGPVIPVVQLDDDGRRRADGAGAAGRRHQDGRDHPAHAGRARRDPRGRAGRCPRSRSAPGPCSSRTIWRRPWMPARASSCRPASRPRF